MRKRGFTLIELLIVVAIIAILAAIAIPNFLEAQVRAKVARVKSEIRNLATAMESYYTDNRTYLLSWFQIDPSSDSSGSYPYCLTSPVAYITSYPYDLFYYMAGGEYHPYRIYALTPTGVYTHSYEFFMPTSTWSTWSIGPDLFPAAGGYRTPDAIFDDESMGREKAERGGSRYDPTNGTLSYGEIFWWGGNYSTWDAFSTAKYW